ncbi:hypothetical protein FNZ56_05900 [Pseudoluteimonas lycopersici]|uniref:Uncharacterized protein n=1 Tax=Pseudoluteimonas lycopersici TaxID=1324796 RepID=A0A516V4G9_9GAMM|nr:hypothetical protein [Lysobacter lycopersici]QDQ73432.1 hypothetical protein FNZ56_05900 [Lysobacter lycopersici]
MLHFEDRTGLPYQGPDRRKGRDRRTSSDRRHEIRFELDKDDRRSGRDRRRNQGSWDNAHSR